MKKSIYLLLFLSMILSVAMKAYSAAPANDELYSGGSCNAVTLALDGTCVTGESNVDATADYYGGCINSSYPSVFYTFSLSSASVNAVDITLTNLGGGGSDVSILLFDGTCDVPSGISASCNATGTVFSSYDPVFGTTYYLMLATEPGGGNTITYDICSQEYYGTGTRTGPEQDCEGAIPVCSDTYTEANSYTGYWDTQEIPVGATCLFGGENNSVWYILTPQAAGDLYFDIVTAKDYDFALYDITTIGCAGIPSATPIRCNYSDNAGTTGLDPGYGSDPKLPAIPVAWNGSELMEGVDVVVGDVFALLIDNWSGDNTGFDLDFTSSVSTSMADVTAPTFSSATPSCGGNTVAITMSEIIDCITISEGDFVLTNTATSTDYTTDIILAVGTNCGGFTDELVFTYTAGALPTGPYEISVIASPVLADLCGNVIANTETVAFSVVDDLTLTPSVASICSGGSVNLVATGALPSTVNAFTLEPGTTTANSDASGNATYSGLTPTSTTTYTVSTTYSGCTKSASATVTVEENIVVSITPIDPQICSGTETLTASVTIDGVACPSCTFVWDDGGASATAAITDVPATYTVTATTPAPASCPGGNTPSSTISLASAGASGSCNLYYVDSYNGTVRDGTTKGLPTSLTDAISKSLCTSTTIKMQAKVYTFTSNIIIGSYITIEGGFNSDFTIKSSDLSGGANSTTIRRTSSADSDDATACSAFSTGNTKDGFRFQDLRIELPGSPSVAGHSGGEDLSNYGIRIGNTCSNYNIVRCYIDAGVGSNP